MLKQIILVFYFIFLSNFIYGQINDNFSDGDFTTNPVWNGNTPMFIVNSAEQLQLNSAGSDTSYLSTANTSINTTEWNFWVKLSFAPSDNNYVKIYIVSDQQNLKGALNGYFIRMGENGSFDSVDLWEQTGTTQTKIIDGVNGHCGKSSNTLRIKVTRDNVGLWKLYSDTLGGTNYGLEGSVTNTTHTSTSYFGVNCKYTTSNATKFYVDDVYIGPIVVDTIAPIISSVIAKSATDLDVYFNEAIETTTAETTTNYVIDGGIGTPLSALHDASNKNLVHLTFSNSFMVSQSYSLTINGVKDVNENTCFNLSTTFVLPDHAQANDIVVNEILADPNTGGVDFLEVYNRSNKVLDFSEVKFASFDTLTQQIKSAYNIVNSRKLFYPNEYYVLCTDVAAVKSQYITTNPNGFIQMNTMPSMNIDAGLIGIIDTSNSIIDKMTYYQSMHFPTLNSTKGISLERISSERNSDDKTNWHSAAEGVGYATPAYKNSQAVDVNSGKEIALNPEIFSPDNDGYNDVLTISYTFENPGNVANIRIYDSNGRMIRSFIQNQLLGTTGSFSWDGITDKLEKAPIGIYIIHFQVYTVSGAVKNYKKTTVLASKLN